MTEIRDYNGKGRWSRESISSRFQSYAKSFGTTVNELEPRTFEEGSVKWVYPLMEAAIAGIEKKDLACIELGIELIEDGASMPFGMILKSNTARALRSRADLLTEDQRDRIRNRVADMLISEYMPREFLQYVKLCRDFGFDKAVSRVESEADLDNRWVRLYLGKLKSSNDGDE